MFDVVYPARRHAVLSSPSGCSMGSIGIRILLSVLLAARVSTPLAAQSPAEHGHSAHAAHAANDTTFESMQRRGRDAMGVDPYTSAHRFDALADGGRIELRRDRDDSAGTARIREHMRDIARVFAAGDFGTPATVHVKTVHRFLAFQRAEHRVAAPSR